MASASSSSTDVGTSNCLAKKCCSSSGTFLFGGLGGGGGGEGGRERGRQGVIHASVHCRVVFVQSAQEASHGLCL